MGAVLKNGNIFLHIPKTGGNWVISILQERKLIFDILKSKHMQMKHIGLKRQNFIFAFVRHPVTWYESWYRYQMANDWKQWQGFDGYVHPCEELNDCADNDFNKFIGNVIDKHPGFLTNMYELFTKDCKFIGKQETMRIDMIKIFKRMKTKANVKYIKKLKKENVSKLIYETDWNFTLKQQIQELEKSIMERYKYERFY